MKQYIEKIKVENNEGEIFSLLNSIEKLETELSESIAAMTDAFMLI